MFPVHDFPNHFFKVEGLVYFFYKKKKGKPRKKHRKSMKIDKILSYSLGKMKTKDPVKKTFWTFIFVQKKIVGQRIF